MNRKIFLAGSLLLTVCLVFVIFYGNYTSLQNANAVNRCSATQYATRIVSTSGVVPGVRPLTGQAESVLGVPDNQAAQFSSYVTVGFADSVSITNGPGSDIAIYLMDFTTREDERFEVLASSNGTSFVSLGTIIPNQSAEMQQQTIYVDLATGGLQSAKMVKIQNLHVADRGGGSHQGPDIDAIQALHFDCVDFADDCSDGANNDQICVGSSVYNVDSCGNQTLSQDCGNTNQTCSNGACISTGGGVCSNKLFDPKATKAGLQFRGISNTISGATSTLAFKVKNTTSNAKSFTIANVQCRCPEHLGDPAQPSTCSRYWSPTSNPSCVIAPQRYTLAAGTSRNFQTSVTQHNNQMCGSFQLDFLLTHVDGKPFGAGWDQQYIGSSFTDLCVDCQIQAKSQCSDGNDNDGDGLTDYPNDPGCASLQDNSEFNGSITCSTNAQCGTNGYTDDSYCSAGNTIYRHYKTWTCSNPGTTNSSCTYDITPQLQSTCPSNQTCSAGACVNNPTYQCSDGDDNDGDGLTDYPSDPGCTGRQDNNEFNQASDDLTAVCATSPNPAMTNQTVIFNATGTGGTGAYTYAWSYACSASNGTLTENGKKCSRSFANSGDYSATVTITSGNQTKYATCNVGVNQPTITPQCSDGQDNDNDGSTDFPNDFSCGSATDNDEANPKAACQDGQDNDGDNLIDYPNDPGCTSKQDNSEFNQVTNTLTATCSSSPNPANINQNVVFFATPEGGNGNYTYEWSGTCTGTSANCSKSFSFAGTYSETLKVRSAGQIFETQCSATVSQANNLQVSCTASPNPANTNQVVTFIPTYSGGSGNYSFNWRGNCTGTAQNCTATFSTAGQRNATVDVATSDGQTKSATCYVDVNQINNLAVSCYATPNPVQVGSQTTFIASASGGLGNYTYSWSGVNCNNSSNQNCIATINQNGNTTANVTVWSGSESRNTQCTVSTNQSCVSNSYQQCLGGNVHRFNSCGVDEGVSQYCTGNQTCSGNTCVNQTTTNLTVTKQVRNLSTGNLNWSNSIGAVPSDILQFQITVQSYGNQFANNVIIRDILPANLIYKDALTVDGVSSIGSISGGINIGSISYGQTRTIAYQVQVAPAPNFAFGTTTLTNSVNASSTSLGFATSNTASATVVVTRGGVLGATDVPTGLTNNFWVDSFLLPMLLALAGLWLYKSRMIRVPAWVGTMQARNRSMSVAAELESKIAQIRKQEIA